MNEEKKQQVIALGRLGWSLRQIERATGVRRETAAAYLKVAGVPLRPPGGWGRHDPKPAIEVITDSAPAETAFDVVSVPVPAKLANEVTTDFGAELKADKTGTAEPQPGRSPSASACERKVIDATGMTLMAGFIDDHRHIIQAGGRGPEAVAKRVEPFLKTEGRAG